MLELVTAKPEHPLIPVTTKIFVYGTLMTGFGNNRLLRSSKLLRTATTRPEFTMLHLGGFPGIVRGGDTVIHGEVWEVDQSTLHDLDRLESHPNFYRREDITLSDVEDAQVYVLPQHWLSQGNRIILSGDWRNHYGRNH